jgi:molybdate transport system permease protein
MSEESLISLGLTFRLAAVATIALLLVGVPLAWWLSQTRSRWKGLAGSLVTLPMVLPPTVLGFYLLLLLGPNGPVGKATQWLGVGLLPFTFAGLVVASVIQKLPFVVQPIQNAFEAMGRRPMEVAASLRASPLDAFFSVALPLARPGILTGAILGFAHTVGEFGVVLMIGGNIPGVTRVAAVQIYNHVEALEYTQAHALSAALLGLSFLAMQAVYALNRRRGEGI